MTSRVFGTSRAPDVLPEARTSVSNFPDPSGFSVLTRTAIRFSIDRAAPLARPGDIPRCAISHPDRLP